MSAFMVLIEDFPW